MTVLEYVKYTSKTNRLVGLVGSIELSQDQISELYTDLWKDFDYNAMMYSDGIDRINYVLQRVGLSNVKLKKMEKQKVKYTIEVPEGMEVDQVTFKPIKTTYIDVCKELFRDRMNYIESIGTIAGSKSTGNEKYNPNNATTSKQLEKLLSFNKLMNVAVYLNPNKESTAWSIILNDAGGVDCGVWINAGQPCFIDRDTCMKAVEILGKTTIKVALGRL